MWPTHLMMRWQINECMIITMNSDNTYLGIDIDSPAMAFFDFNGTNGEDITSILNFNAKWDGEKQVVTANAAPIPTTLLLLGTGLFGLVSARKKISRHDEINAHMFESTR